MYSDSDSITGSNDDYCDAQSLETDSCWLTEDDDSINEEYIDILQDMLVKSNDNANKWYTYIKQGDLLYFTVYNYMRSYKFIDSNRYYDEEEIYVRQFGDLITSHNLTVKHFIRGKINIQCDEIDKAVNKLTIFPKEIRNIVKEYLGTDIIRKAIKRATIPFNMRNEMFGGNIIYIMFNYAPEMLADVNLWDFIPIEGNKISNSLLNIYHTKWCMHPYTICCLCELNKKYRNYPIINKNSKMVLPNYELYEFWNC